MVTVLISKATTIATDSNNLAIHYCRKKAEHRRNGSDSTVLGALLPGNQRLFTLKRPLDPDLG